MQAVLPEPGPGCCCCNLLLELRWVLFQGAVLVCPPVRWHFLAVLVRRCSQDQGAAGAGRCRRIAPFQSSRYAIWALCWFSFWVWWLHLKTSPRWSAACFYELLGALLNGRHLAALCGTHVDCPQLNPRYIYIYIYYTTLGQKGDSVGSTSFGQGMVWSAC